MLPSEQTRPDIARKRECWKRYQDRIDSSRQVFIDETWVAYAPDQLVCLGLSEKTESILGLDPRSPWFQDMVDPFIVEPDWQALAAEAGETATEDEIERWSEFADRIMMQEA